MQCSADFAAGQATLDALMACYEGPCAVACPITEICEAGLSGGDAACDACLSAGCCTEFEACTDTGMDVNACLECFTAGSGPLCDAAMACLVAKCEAEC